MKKEQQDLHASKQRMRAEERMQTNHLLFLYCSPTVTCLTGFDSSMRKETRTLTTKVIFLDQARGNHMPCCCAGMCHDAHRWCVVMYMLHARNLRRLSECREKNAKQSYAV
jgi:hypothetical protein